MLELGVEFYCFESAVCFTNYNLKSLSAFVSVHVWVCVCMCVCVCVCVCVCECECVL